MEPIIELIYGVPIVGLVAQLIGYLVAILPDIAPIVYRAAIPIGFAALCGVMCERSGVVNIGIEGTMLVAAFVGWAAGVFLIPVLGEGDPGQVFGVTPAILVAFLLAILSGLIVAAVHAWLSISVKADQIIAGTIINIAAFGITGYLNTLIAKSSPSGAGAFTKFEPPEALTEIPFVGWIFEMFLAQGPIGMSLLVIVIAFQVFLFRSRWGLRTRSVGEHPRAAETVGINVIALRYRNVIVAGGLAALGGAFLSLEVTGSFQQGMTAGRGFIGLAAMIIGRWTPLGAFGAALLFASSTAIGQSIGFAPPPGELGTVLGQLPTQFWDALPYLVTIVVLAGVVGKSIPPAADGQPYEREAAT
ncbi:MAG TPA: ABC transporter permease [Candidatus Limnocylindrales bacterium]|nr:ABC transporter permease [Candidatus Limnocylindrales bacterium]